MPVPGVITLANRGIVFMDELPEFGRENLDLLRQPLEDYEITLTRSCGNFVYPARFLLLGAMNPCPCGFYPDRNRCRCTEREIRRYQARVSGPVLDRIDLCTETQRVEFAELIRAGKQEREGSRAVLQRVMAARERQRERFEGTELLFNSDMGPGRVGELCPLGPSEERLMARLFDMLHLTARACHRMLRVARTIADLSGEEHIREEHLLEAAGFRMRVGPAAENAAQQDGFSQ